METGYICITKHGSDFAAINQILCGAHSQPEPPSQFRIIQKAFILGNGLLYSKTNGTAESRIQNQLFRFWLGIFRSHKYDLYTHRSFWGLPV